jgi:hypothetical protein
MPDVSRPLLRNDTERRSVVASIPASILGQDICYSDLDIRDFSRSVAFLYVLFNSSFSIIIPFGTV